MRFAIAIMFAVAVAPLEARVKAEAPALPGLVQGLPKAKQRTKAPTAPEPGEKYYWLNLVLHAMRVRQPFWKTGNEFLVLSVLADHANRKTGSCYPAIDRIRKQSGLSRRTVRRTLADLSEKRDRKNRERRPLVKIEPNAGPNGTDLYTLLLEQPAKLSPTEAPSARDKLSTDGDELAADGARLSPVGLTSCHELADRLAPEPCIEEPCRTEPSEERARVNSSHETAGSVLTNAEKDSLVDIAHYYIDLLGVHQGREHHLHTHIMKTGQSHGIACDLKDAEDALHFALDGEAGR